MKWGAAGIPLGLGKGFTLDEGFGSWHPTSDIMAKTQKKAKVAKPASFHKQPKTTTSKVKVKAKSAKKAKPAAKAVSKAKSKPGAAPKVVKVAKAVASKILSLAASKSPVKAAKPSLKAAPAKQPPVKQPNEKPSKLKTGAVILNTGKTEKAPVAAPLTKLTKAAKGLKKSLTAKEKREAKKFSGAMMLAFDEAYCREMGCESRNTTGGYCRMHYIKNWKKIQVKRQIISEGRLNRFIAELVAKYPDKYLEAIRNDLAIDKEFAKVMIDLEIIETVTEDAPGYDEDSDTQAESYIDNIRRDFGEADGDAF